MISIIFLAISFLFIGILIIFLLSQKPQTTLTILFSLKLVCIEIWLFGTMQMFLNVADPEKIIFWDRIVYIGAIAFPPLLAHFTAVFVNKFEKNKIIIFGSYITSVFFLIVSRFSIFVDGVFIYTWGAHTQAQVMHHFFVLYFIIIVAWSIITLIRHYKSQTDIIEKVRTKYIILSFIFLYGISFFAYLPAYNISIYPIPFVTGIFFTFFIVYAITRYRLMSLQMIIRRSMIYIICASIFISVLVLLTLFLVQYDVIKLDYIIYIYLIIIVLLSLKPANEMIKRIFIRTKYDFTLDTNSKNELGIYLLEYFTPLYNSLRQEVKLDMFYLYAFRPEVKEKTFVLEFPEVNEKDYFEISDQNYAWLQNLDSLLRVEDLKQFHDIRNILKATKGEILVPLVASNALVGFIVVKISAGQNLVTSTETVDKYRKSIASLLLMALNLKYIQRQ